MQCADVWLLDTLRPYTHVFTSATCARLAEHLFKLAAANAPMRVTTFEKYVKKAVQKYNGSKHILRDEKGKRVGLTLTGSNEVKTIASYSFTGN